MTHRLSGGEQAESESPTAEHEIYTDRNRKTHTMDCAKIGTQRKPTSPTEGERKRKEASWSLERPMGFVD